MAIATIKRLTGLVNGTNVFFTAPSIFVAGSLRLVLNGQVYEPDDMKWGWSELTTTTIQLVTAPRTGDEVQAFYQDASGGGGGGDVIKGSPFAPGECGP